MAPRAITSSNNDDLPLSEIEDLVLKNVEDLCAGKPLMLGNVMEQLCAIVKGVLLKKESTLSSKPNQLADSLFNYVWPHLIDELSIEDSINETDKRVIRARKITSVKFLNYDKYNLLPAFSDDEGDITSQDRRDAKKSVNGVDLLKGGKFSGKDDSRSIRRVLISLRDTAIDEGWSALEYREMMKRQITPEARKVVHPVAVTTYAELKLELKREVSGLLIAYGRGDSGKLDSWLSLLQLRQGKNEKLSAFAQRFQDAQEEARCFGNDIDDYQSTLQFASAVNTNWAFSAANLIGTGVTNLDDLVARLISEERVFKRALNGSPDSVTVVPSPTRAVPATASGDAKVPIGTSPSPLKVCYYCREPGHLKSECPKLAQKEARSKAHDKPDPKKPGLGDDSTVRPTSSTTSQAAAMVVHKEPECLKEAEENCPAVRQVAICFHSSLRKKGGNEKLWKRALFDSGASLNYIGLSLVKSLQLAGCPCKVDNDKKHSVLLADGSHVDSEGRIELVISYDGSSKRLFFHIVPSLSPKLFIGWEGMTQLGIVIDPSHHGIFCSSNGLNEDDDVGNDLSRAPLLARVGRIPDDYISVKKTLEKYDPDLEKYDRWFHLSSAPAYKMRVRRLLPSEQRDTPEQVYCFELDLQGAMHPIDDISYSRDYSGKLIQRLSSEEKDLFYKEVESYVDKNWWRKETDSSFSVSKQASDQPPLAPLGLLGIPPIVVFPVKQPGKSTAIRPCCDCRLCNSVSERASYLGADVSTLTSRLLGSYRQNDSFCTLDCSRAFYRLRTNVRLPLVINGQKYSSDRVIFGLVAGPSSLEFAMNYVLQYTASQKQDYFGIRYDVITGAQKVNKSWIYLDDICIAGPFDALMRFKAAFVETSKKFGLLFPEAKQGVLTPDSGSKRIPHLGSFWGIEDGCLKCFCKRNIARYNELCRVSVRSKRFFFALAGLLTDYPVGHARSRLAVDTIRSIVGSYKSDWDANLDLSPEHVDQVEKLIKILKEDFERPCEHCSASCDIAILECDASSAGFGYIFRLGRFESSRAKPFTKSQSAWHINRREAWCILQGLLSNLPLLEEYTADRERPLRVVVISDSKSAISWLRDNHVYAKSVERLALRRMLNTFEDIRDIFDRMNVQLEFKKVPGIDNVAADELSRLLITWGISSPDNSVTETITEKSDLKSMVRSSSSEKLGEEKLEINGPIEVCSQVLDLQSEDPKKIVLWLLQVQSNDSFISEMRSFLSNESKNDYLRRLLKNEGRWYQLDHHGLVVECRFRNGEVTAPRFCILLPNYPQLLSGFARHYHETNGHCSVRYVQYLFTRDFVAPKFRQVAETVIRECSQCVEKRVKLASSGGRCSYGDSTVDLDGVWSTVYADVGDMLIKDRFGYRYFVAMVDALSSFCWLVPLKSLEARELCRAVSGVCERVGWCHNFKSDNGGAFISRLFRSLLKSQ
ncbi:hypothetical protein FOL47_008291 [Perkinsus chesapeaki]|uniref:Uncharacterized protein n=1 Tax=Perkinsus chesapeaki TaxID=330153 RepID=A0A7J6LF26_PERCH|nr:hypothetical protein FOL47_008291 [Perkinsus chesapeaki]